MKGMNKLTEKQVSETLKPYGVTLQKRNGSTLQYRVFLTGRIQTAIVTDDLADALETGLELQMNTYTNLIVEGHDYAQALLKHSIDPIRALRLIADDDQRLALQSYIDSLVPPPVPSTKPAKLDKVATQVVRCREAAKGRRQCLAIRRVSCV